MVELTKDKKSPTFIITKTDEEGFHQQINLTHAELDRLFALALIEEMGAFVIGI